ncbi:MAG: hypothetical protein SPJ19_04755 [Candidatus Borkfalkiaceae bacterium]|nr:hypothetical protein [Christensenellaceae bacterium]
MFLTPEEKQKRKEERKVQRALKIARLRSLKNFGWWLFGLISSVFITIGIIALCIFVVPINTVTGNSTDRYVKEEISSKTIYGAVMAFSEGNYTADQVLYIDNIIDDVQDENVKSLLKTLVNDEVRNTPLTSGGASVVDAIMKNAQNLEVVSTLRLFTNEPIVDDIEGILGNATIGSLTSGTFDFNGVKLSAIASIANINLDELKIGDQVLLDIVYETVSNDSEITEKPASKEDITIGNLTTLKVEKLAEKIPLDTFIKETPDNSKIYSVLRTLADKEGGEEIFIGDLLSVTNERVNAIKISSIVDLDEKVKDVLYGALDDSKYTSENPKPANKNEITVGDFGNVNVDIIKLNDVATLDPDVLEVLYGALDDSKYNSENPKPANKDEITVGDLKNVNKDGVKLGSVIPRNTENANLYAILDGAFGGNAEDKTISDLSSFNINDITLGTVFKKSENVEMYKILDEVLDGDAENKKIADLSDFNIGNIKIGTVIPNNAGNAEIYKLLNGAFADAENTKLSELSTFNLGNVKIGTVLARSGNEKFYKVLDEVFGADSHDKKLEELNDFDLTRIHLSIALDVPTAENGYKNKTIYDVLLQATGKTSYSEITLSHLSGSFDINSVKLSTIMSKGENKTVNALLDSDATVGNIGEKLNSLSIYDIYGTDCFTKTPHGTQTFTLTTEAGKAVYTVSPTGEYYISENAGIWLLICFDSEKDGSGKIVKYTEANVTLNDLSNNNVIKDRFTSATVRQLIAAGIVADPGFSNSDYYDHTLIEILGIIAMLP